jgi:hypothetical protein
MTRSLLELHNLGREDEVFTGRHGIDLDFRRRLHVDGRIDFDFDRPGRFPIAIAA